MEQGLGFELEGLCDADAVIGYLTPELPLYLSSSTIAVIAT